MADFINTKIPMEIEAELKSKLEQLYNRVESLKEQINTEEATKNAFIMPFLQILGYDVFNPTEVIPEYVADIGTKKGEKVDYVIKKDGQVVIIIECKHWKENINAHNSQLHRYYHVTDARFGVITNGIVYDFFTDLEKPNIMDNNPFLTVNLANLKDSTIKELVKFTKATFSIDNIIIYWKALKLSSMYVLSKTSSRRKYRNLLMILSSCWRVDSLINKSPLGVWKYSVSI